jgi:hypothetical protein
LETAADRVDGVAARDDSADPAGGPLQPSSPRRRAALMRATSRPAMGAGLRVHQRGVAPRIEGIRNVMVEVRENLKSEI